MALTNTPRWALIVAPDDRKRSSRWNNCSTRRKDLGIDRVEIRRRNMIPPEAMPYETPNGPIYDSGEFAVTMDKALALAEWDGFAERRAASEAAGKRRGIGLACFLEVAGGILEETVDLRFEGDGATLRTGVQAMGQSHLTTYTRFIGKRLGIPASKVRLIEGDSLHVPPGTPRWPHAP